MPCCAVLLQAVNTATVTPTDGGTPVSDSATVNLAVTGCTAASATSALSGASAITVTGVTTVVVNSYTWYVTVNWVGLTWYAAAHHVRPGCGG